MRPYKNFIEFVHRRYFTEWGQITVCIFFEIFGSSIMAHTSAHWAFVMPSSLTHNLQATQTDFTTWNDKPSMFIKQPDTYKANSINLKISMTRISSRHAVW